MPATRARSPTPPRNTPSERLSASRRPAATPPRNTPSASRRPRNKRRGTRHKGCCGRMGGGGYKKTMKRYKKLSNKNGKKRRKTTKRPRK